MSRLASIAKAGYFPTPDRVTQLITNYLGRPLTKDAQVTFYGRVIDPCAGKGTAVACIANHLEIESFGIELDAHRWFEAQKVLTKALHLDYNSARVTRDSFSLLYLNPPYDVNDDKDTKRLEFEFLKDTSDWLAPGGILVYIIPQPQFNPRVVRWLTSHYTDVRIYRFPDPEYGQFRQTVAFGIKKDTPSRDEDAEEKLNQVLRVEFGVNLLPVLGDKVHKVYAIPPVDKDAKFVFRSSEVSAEDALKEAMRDGAWYGKNWHNWLSPHKVETFRPLMPLKKGHLAMLIASGMMQNLILEENGAMGEPSQRIVVKGRTFKILKMTENVEGDEERAKDVFVTEIVALNLATGEMERLNDPVALGKFIDKWQGVITEKVMGSYTPIYRFDYAADAPVLNTLSLHRRLPGRAETGLFEAQKHISSAMAAHYRNGNNSAILVGEMGTGKAQPLNEWILTTNGFVRNGDLSVGDYVIGANGKPTKVVGIFPQGTRQVYRVEFTDGAVTHCTDDHLWQVQSPLRKQKGKCPKVLPLSQIRQKLAHANGNLQHFIPVVKPIEMPKLDLPLHPYLLGYLLGNGCLVKGTPSVTIPDQETIQRIESLLPDGMYLDLIGAGTIDYRVTTRREQPNNPVTCALRDMRLFGSHSDTKFIPEDYLNSSLQDRIALLQGLMDSDGYAQNACPEYITASVRLASDVTRLAQSLGGTVSYRLRKEPKFTYNGETRIGKPAHRLRFNLPNEIDPFLLSRKAQLHQKRTKYLPTRAFKRITHLGKMLCQCIKVEAEDGLYVASHDYVVTHNTTIGSAIIAALGARANPTLILCPPHLTKKWLREIREIVPNAYAMELAHFRDVDTFFQTTALQHKDVQCFAIVSREKAKLGSGWRAAYRIKKIGHRDPFDDTVSTAHVFVCPKCGAPVTDEDGAIVTKTDYFERKRFCTEVDKTTNRECGEPLWQATHLNGEEGSLQALGQGKAGARRTRYPIADYIYRKHKGQFKFFIADECFPAGTRISTPNGDVPIEKIQVGDFVTSYQGGAITLKRVVRTIAKPRSQELVRVKHAYGEVICTPNHKFWTDNGYVPASQLMTGTQLIFISNESYPMPSVRKPIPPNPHKTKRSVENMQPQLRGEIEILGGKGTQKATPQDRCAKNLQTMWQGICAQLPATQPSCFLQQVVFCQMDMAEFAANARNWGQDQIGATTTARIGTDEKKQPKPKPGSQSANDRIYEGPMVRTTGWQWNRTDNTPIYVTRLDRLSVGASDCDRQSQVDMCGAGPGKPHSKNCHRSRWAHSQSAQAKDERQNQGTDAQRTGLDGSALYKLTSDQSDTSSSACYQRCRESTVISVNPIQSQEEWVYDLEVEDTHCYFANGVLVSNCHELKHQSTDQGYAFGTLVRACHRTLGMTGTLFGGYASSIFFILHRLFPKFRKEYGWRESQDFVARYGVLERVTKFDDGDDGYGRYSGRKRSKTYVRELPGSSPELAILLLDSTCFLSLQDLGFDLPPFQEYPRVISMATAQQKEYDDLDNYMKAEVRERMANGDKSLLSAYLQSTLGYPNACFRVNEVTDKYDKIIYTAPMLGDDLFPKEDALVKLATEEQKEGRRLIIFCRQTGTRDITERIVSRLAKQHIRAVVLPSSVAANKREDWINRRVKEGMQVMITNPNLVKTGLDLIAFPTIVFYEMDYSIYTMQQAARRSWRLGQTDDVRVFYYVYDGTMEHRAMALVGSKWNAAEMLVGDSVAAALAQESDGGGSFLQELARNVIHNAPVEDLQTLFRQRGVANKDDYIGFDKLPTPILPPVPMPILMPPVQPPPTFGQQLTLF